jgi:hypothetical protein
MTEADPNAREADVMLEKFVASLERLGPEGLRERYTRQDRRGRLKAGFEVLSEQLGPSGRLYQFETWVSLEGDAVHVFVSMFPERKASLVRDIDFIVGPDRPRSG